MEKKNLSAVNILWISGLTLVLTWHVGFSLAQSPADAVYFADSGSSVISNSAVFYPSTVGSSSPVFEASATQSPAAYSASWTAKPISYNMPVLHNGIHWASTVANAKLNLRPELLPKPNVAKSGVEEAAHQLQNFLSTASDDRYANWLVFLKWNELQKELNSKEPDVDTLIQFERNMRQNYFGLELPQFVRLRESLSAYISALRFGDDQETSLELIGRRLDQLSEALQAPADGADATRQREIGFVASILAQSKQSPDLLQTVRGQFSRPNVRVLVSNTFLQRQFSRPVTQPTPVREEILGTQIFGNSLLNGSAFPMLVDNPRNASIRFMLAAQMASNSVGYNRGVKIYTTGSANVAVSETVTLTDNGLALSNDISVSAPLNTTITDIDHKLRIVERIASKRAAKQKPQADSIAQGRLDNRLGSGFHQQLAEQIQQANSRIREPSLPTFARLGLPKPKRASWSSSQYLALLWKQQDKDQLAAPSSCPLVVTPHGITLQIHQSAIINALDPVIGGRIIHHYDLDDIASQLGQAPSESLNKEVSGEAWSIDMAGYHPIEVEFDDQLVKFRIRTTKLDRGDQALEQPATIEAAYKISLTDGAIQLHRQGDVKIDFAGKAQRGTRAVVLRTFLKNKFDSVFKEELLEKPLRLSDRIPANFPKLNVVEVLMDDGWIQATVL
jgi:hypothetical protein